MHSDENEQRNAQQKKWKKKRNAGAEKFLSVTTIQGQVLAFQLFRYERVSFGRTRCFLSIDCRWHKNGQSNSSRLAR